MQITISPHLQSTYKLIQNAFPKGIEPQSYLPLLALLSEEMSDTGLTQNISQTLFSSLSSFLCLRHASRTWFIIP